MMRDVASILPLAADALAFDAGGGRLIDGIELRVDKGDCLALIGPNGAGKTLLLRLLHGLLPASGGRVAWANGSGAVGGRRQHAMVFQSPVMLRRSAVGNVSHALRAAGHGRAEARRRALAALERFGLAELAPRPARVLSGGERQRLAIARAAALEPELLFLDEPSSALDPGATRQVEAMLADLHGGGMTLVFATHDLGQARRLATRVGFLNRGRLVETGPAADILQSPGHDETRAFIAGDLAW
ncbi:MAG: ATP-binding cassette domain-containing protein [Alphaproteobacteria bacterium]